MLLLDGASLDFISPAVAEGRLPNFARMLDDGAVMHLATLRPTQPDPVWTAVATGKLPMRDGCPVRGALSGAAGGPTLDLLPDYCFAHGLVAAGLLTEAPHSSRSLRARPLWAILGASGHRLGSRALAADVPRAGAAGLHRHRPPAGIPGRARR